MTLKKVLAWTFPGMLSFVLTVPASAQAERGKAELKAGSGAITVDYGRPSLKGRDMLSQLQEGAFWRMGMNQATVLTTPVDLSFGATKVAQGSLQPLAEEERGRVPAGLQLPDGAVGDAARPGQGRRAASP